MKFYVYIIFNLLYVLFILNCANSHIFDPVKDFKVPVHRKCNHEKKNHKKNYLTGKYDRKLANTYYNDIQFQNMRIHFDYTYTLPHEEKIIKELVMPPVKKFYENTLSVRRFPGKIRFPRSVKDCQGIPVPKALQKEGIDADLVIIVSTYRGMKKYFFEHILGGSLTWAQFGGEGKNGYSNLNDYLFNYFTKSYREASYSEFFNKNQSSKNNTPPWEINDSPGDVVGWSFMCLQDIYTLRPVAGVMQYVADINPTPRAIEEAIWTTLHEIMHVLAMDFDLYADFIDSDFNRLNYDKTLKMKTRLQGLDKILEERKDVLNDLLAFANFNSTINLGNNNGVTKNSTISNVHSHHPHNNTNNNTHKNNTHVKKRHGANKLRKNSEECTSCKEKDNNIQSYSYNKTNTHVDLHNITHSHLDLHNKTNTHVDSHNNTHSHLDLHNKTNTHVDSHNNTHIHVGSDSHNISHPHISSHSNNNTHPHISSNSNNNTHLYTHNHTHTQSNKTDSNNTIHLNVTVTNSSNTLDINILNIFREKFLPTITLPVTDQYYEIQVPKNINLTVLVLHISNFLDHTKLYIKTPKVVEYGRKHFGCSSLDGVELEHFGGLGSSFSHWSKRILNTEFMIADSYGENHISNFTLALLEDSGWYKVDYSKSESIPWGKNKGCEFLEEKCIMKKKKKNSFFSLSLSSGGDKNENSTNIITPHANIYDSNFKDEFCTSFEEEKCSISHTFRAICGVNKFKQPIPKEYQYFDNPNVGGFVNFGDYCPYPIEWMDPNSIFPMGSCRNGIQLRPEIGEKICENCRCFHSSLVEEKFYNTNLEKLKRNYNATKYKHLEDTRAACYEARCRADKTGKVELIIIVNDVEIKCPRGGALLTIDGYKGFIECPKVSTVCTGTLDPKADYTSTSAYNLFSHLSEQLLKILYDFINDRFK